MVFLLNPWNAQIVIAIGTFAKIACHHQVSRQISLIQIERQRYVLIAKNECLSTDVNR